MTKYQVTVDGKTYAVEVGDVTTSPVQVTVDGVVKSVAFQVGEAPQVSRVAPAQEPQPAAEPQAEAEVDVTPASAVSGARVVAPMPGKILSVMVEVGQAIKEGDTVCTLEAMKMEMPISSTGTGTIKAIHVAAGQTVAYDDPLVTLD